MVRLTTLLVLYMGVSSVWGAPVVKSRKTDRIQSGLYSESRSTLGQDVNNHPRDTVGGTSMAEDIVKVDLDGIMPTDTGASGESPRRMITLRLSRPRREMAEILRVRSDPSSESALERRSLKEKLKRGWQNFKKKIGKVMEKVATIATAVMRFIPNPITAIISTAVGVGMKVAKVVKAAKALKKANEAHHAEKHADNHSSGNHNNQQPPPHHKR
ncbi:hypothetical protein CPB83DRAFT_839961 [Crepidotus variabilis]|uniref:Uncharacterized protein n=1 Tax=Crepidotus variabilis TaxID=179855 RepID=A0A9P6E5Z4_9AGAR|nr:hypothetical protein CPB83DRAFT_839961 [Crepidotus variabilis]